MNLRCSSQQHRRPWLALFVTLVSSSAACSIERSPTRLSGDSDSVDPGDGDAQGSNGDGDGDGSGHTGDGDGDGNGDGDGDPGQHDGDSDAGTAAPGPGSDGGTSLPVGDYALAIDGSGVDQLCRLSANHQRLIVRVTNQGSGRSPAAALELRTPDGDHMLRAQVPQLEGGASKDVGFDRATLVGYRDRWQFRVTLDPDAALGEPQAQEGVCSGPRTRTAQGMAFLLKAYDPASGTWPDGTWWHTPRMLSTLVNYVRETGDSEPLWLLANTLEKQGNGNFLSESYDDEGYWAVLWLNAYELTHRQRYLDIARSLFGDLTGAYSDSCKGGLFRGKVHGAKYASTNALMMLVAARLARYATNEQDRKAFLSWAEGTWAWFQSTAILTGDKLVLDSLDAQCAPSGVVLTGNQGLLLGGLVELWLGTGRAELLEQAHTLAQAVLSNMVDAGGILHEVGCEPGCGEGDVVLHKGMFVEQLARLHALRPQAAYQAFLLRQGDALWALSKNGADEFGQSWAGPFDRPDPLRQAAAIDALVAAVMVEQPNVSLGKTATGSEPCIPFETVERVLDGSSRLDSKWCSSGASGQVLTIDLGALRKVTGFRVRHAGSAGEDAGWNTRAFELQLSADNEHWQDAVSVVDNTESVTTHPVPAQAARFVRLHVSAAQTREDAQAARIYELETFAVGQP